MRAAGHIVHRVETGTLLSSVWSCPKGGDAAGLVAIDDHPAHKHSGLNPEVATDVLEGIAIDVDQLFGDQIYLPVFLWGVPANGGLKGL